MMSVGMITAPLSPVFTISEIPGFNPNFLISDEELQQYTAMDRSDIQAFLKEQPGTLHTLITEDKDGSTRTAADIIHRAAVEHRINPKYLLVKLQKEQSLITDPTPTEKQLNGATGYGITDGCGWTCDMYERNKGFGKQVDSAAGIMRWYYDNMDSQSWIKRAGETYTINNTTIRPASNATAFLYTYTPHLEGNANFWKLWQQWFDQVYPNGTLVKVATDPTVYLIQEGKRFPFGSMVALTTRFDPKRIITIPASELNRYELGAAISLPNYSLLQQGTSYYLLDGTTLRPFDSANTVRALGYNPDEIISVTAEDINGFTIGKTIYSDTPSVIGEVIKKKGSTTLYYYKENTLFPISDPQIATVNFPQIKPKEIDTATLPNPELGASVLFSNGTLILIPGSNHVYVIEDGKKRHIVSEEVFLGLGYRWDQIIRTDILTGMLHPTGQPVYLRSTAPQTAQETTVAEQSPETTSKETSPSTDSTFEQIAAQMVRTPKSATTFIGAPFVTDMDSYLVMDMETEEIILGKNINSVRPIASLTKVVTASTVLEKGLDLTALSTYDAADHKAIYHRFRIVDGEQVRYSDLLDAVLVSSLNTPTRMLVDGIQEQESVFIAALNTKARALGLEKTLFTSVTGEKEDTVSTAKEYATLFLEAIRNDTVRAYMGKQSYSYAELLDIDGKPNHFDTHTNELMTEKDLGFRIIASKTGYLYESGANLAMLVRRHNDNKEFLIITLGNVDYKQPFREPKRLSEFVMNNL